MLILLIFAGFIFGTNIHYNDEILYKIEHIEFNSSTLHLKDFTSPNIINFNNKLWCILPESINHMTNKHTRLSPVLIEDVLRRHHCTTMNFGYWVYEICHGKRVRQYHLGEKKLKHEKHNYIGYVSDEILNSSVSVVSQDDILTLKQFEGINTIPHVFVMVNYTDGEICHTNNIPRYASVYYVCLQYDEPTILSVREINMCAYRFIIGLKELCDHEVAARKAFVINPLTCYLDVVEKKVFDFPADENTNLMDLLRVVEKSINLTGVLLESNNTFEGENVKERFFSGSLCMSGNNSYWTFVFCYEKSLNQSYLDKGGNNVTQNMGIFDPELTKTESDRVLVHEYTNGSKCGDSNQTRSSTVYMTCKEDGKEEDYSLLVTEVDSCSYTVKVVGSIFCL